MMDLFLGNLPRGFRFHPTDEELIYYLKLKIQGMDDPELSIIHEVDVCKLEPWDLPDFSMIKTDDRVWYFFSPLDYKYSKGSRSNRATSAGYWKPTGQDRDIESATKKEVIGTRKTLVFYKGRGRKAVRTNWVIYEYRADTTGLAPNQAYVLCRLKEKHDKKKKGSDVSAPDEVVADTGIDRNDLVDNMRFVAGPSHHSSNIATDIGKSQEQEMTSYDDSQLAGLRNDIIFSPTDLDWLIDIEKELLVDLPSPTSFNSNEEIMQFLDWDDMKFVDGLIVDPDEYHSEELTSQRSSTIENCNLNHGSVGDYGQDWRSSSNTNTQVPQGICLGVKDRAGDGSVTDLHQNKNPIIEFKKDCKFTETHDSKLIPVRNEPTRKNHKGSYISPETVPASHEPSSSPGTNQPVITKKNRTVKMQQKKHVRAFRHTGIC